jgi:hypothetical protein
LCRRAGLEFLAEFFRASISFLVLGSELRAHNSKKLITNPQHRFLRKRILAWFINIKKLTKFFFQQIRKFSPILLEKNPNNYSYFFFGGEKITWHDLQLRKKTKKTKNQKPKTFFYKKHNITLLLPLHTT